MKTEFIKDAKFVMSYELFFESLDRIVGGGGNFIQSVEKKRKFMSYQKENQKKPDIKQTLHYQLCKQF